MTNWTALLGTALGVKVRKTTRSWIVLVEVLRGRNPVEVANLAMHLANQVCNALVSKYGCVLGEGGIVGGELAQEDPVASLFGRYFTVRSDRRKIDHSWSGVSWSICRRLRLSSICRCLNGSRKWS
jgi:hypothetical protein